VPVELPVLLLLLLVAGVAGFVDAVAGGGGLIQLPPLLAVLGPAAAPHSRRQISDGAG
jgi:hypothetical protein